MDSLLNKIINYGIRVIIIVMGILIFFDYFGIAKGDSGMVRGIGAIMVLFGIYRMVSFYYASKRFRSLRKNEEEDEE